MVINYLKKLFKKIKDYAFAFAFDAALATTMVKITAIIVTTIA